MTNDAGGQIIDNFLAISKSAVILVLCLLILAIIFSILLRLVSLYRKYRQKNVILEITPPAFQDKKT